MWGFSLQKKRRDWRRNRRRGDAIGVATGVVTGVATGVAIGIGVATGVAIGVATEKSTAVFDTNPFPLTLRAESICNKPEVKRTRLG